MTELTITRPDDWHTHLRDGAALEHTCADMARYFGRSIVMPNLTPPVTTVADAATYRDRVLAATAELPRSFEPLMTLYLTDQTDAAEIHLAAAADFVHGVKLYPAGATTNSEAGVAELDALFPTLATMEEVERSRRPAAGGTTHVSVCDAAGNAASLSLSNGEGSMSSRNKKELSINLKSVPDAFAIEVEVVTDATEQVLPIKFSDVELP